MAIRASSTGVGPFNTRSRGGSGILHAYGSSTATHSGLYSARPGAGTSGTLGRACGRRAQGHASANSYGRTERT